MKTSTIPPELEGCYVTAKTTRGHVRQGAIISLDPLRIRGQSGAEYDILPEVRKVTNPPSRCIGCGLPLGRLCGRCKGMCKALGKAMAEAGLKFTRMELAPIGKPEA